MKDFSDIFGLFDDIVNMVSSFEDKPIYKDIKFCEIINSNKKVLEQIIADQNVDYCKQLREDIVKKYEDITYKYEIFISILNSYITAKTTDAQKPKTVTMTEEELNKIIAEAVAKATADK